MTDIHINKRIAAFPINKTGIHDLLNTVSSTFELTDIMISNMSEDEIELIVTDENKNTIPLINTNQRNLIHSFPTGLRFWKGAQLKLIVNKDAQEPDILITVGYIKMAHAQDISVWRLI